MTEADIKQMTNSKLKAILAAPVDMKASQAPRFWARKELMHRGKKYMGY